MAYIPPLLLEQGLSEGQMTLVLGLGSVFALVFVPKLGKWSDDGKNRRSHIVFLAVVLVSSLCLLSSYDLITQLLKLPRQVATFLLVIGTILLDFATQAAYNPCEALVSDFSEDRHIQRNYSIYSFMLCLGGCIGYLVSAIDWTTVVNLAQNKLTLKFQVIVFLIFITLFTACFAVTYVTLVYVSPTKRKPAVTKVPMTLSCKTRVCGLVVRSKKFIHMILAFVINMPTLPVSIVNDILQLPLALRKLLFTNFLSWCGILCHSLFYTSFVGEVRPAFIFYLLW